MNVDKSWSQRSYDFSKPTPIYALAKEVPLIGEVISTATFQRLKQIRFLGGIDYLIVRVPNGVPGNIRYTRYQHSVGVASLAAYYARELDLDARSRRLMCIAALVHDIGHAPLSHSLEPIFKEVFGIDHHAATQKVLTGESPLGPEIYQLLHKGGVDVEAVLEIVSGAKTEFDGFFNGPINFDTVEGILRTHAYAKLPSNLTHPEIVLNAAIRRATDLDRATVDQFWLYKDWVYRQFINSRSGVLADYVCQELMRQNISRLSPADYYITEPQLFRKLRGLRGLLKSNSFESDITSLLPDQIMHQRRHFFVDASGDFFSRQDTLRYRQSKIDCLLSLAKGKLGTASEVEQDLFNDDGDRTGESALRSYA